MSYASPPSHRTRPILRPRIRPIPIIKPNRITRPITIRRPRLRPRIIPRLRPRIRPVAFPSPTLSLGKDITFKNHMFLLQDLEKDQGIDQHQDLELFHQDQDPHLLSAKDLQQHSPVLNICHLIRLPIPILLRLPLYRIHSG